MLDKRVYGANYLAGKGTGNSVECCLEQVLNRWLMIWMNPGLTVKIKSGVERSRSSSPRSRSIDENLQSLSRNNKRSEEPARQAVPQLRNCRGQLCDLRHQQVVPAFKGADPGVVLHEEAGGR